MSASTLYRPGTKTGPCVEACAHRDCGQTRATVAAICKHCDGSIGYDVRFYEVFRSADGKDRDYAHATCHEAAVERGES